MKSKIFSLPALLIAGLLVANSANAQWTRNIPTSQTYLTNTGDNVGIGTITPAFKLDVQSTTNATMSFKSTNGNASILVDRSDSTKTSSLTYRTNGVNNWQSGCVSSNNYTIRNNGLGSLALFVSYANNNVGIGVNTPGARLDVNGAITAESNQAIHFQGAWLEWNKDFGGGRTYLLNHKGPGVGGFIFGEVNNSDVITERVRIDENGRLGIGTPNPDAKLTVGTPGLTWTDYGITSDSRIGIVNGNNDRNAMIISSTGTSGGKLEAFNYNTSAYNNILISPSGGNVGIGTAAPQVKLDVVGIIQASSNICVDAAQANTGSGTTNTLKFGGNGSGEVIGSKRNAGGNQFGLDFFTGSTNRMSITSVGNVGIGTSSPNAPLQFATSNQKRKVVLFETANNDNQFYGFGVYGGELRYQTGVLTDDHVFYAGATAATSNELMRIKGNGNVGIGTTSPQAKLDVNGDEFVQGSVSVRNNLTPTNYGRLIHTGTGGNFHIDTYGTGGLFLNYFGGSIVQIGNGAAGVTASFLANGNVGVGTQTPAYKLDVCGTIRGKEVRVETGWCDYVFANDYKLAPLSDVESFIKANKHLPDVTSGSEIETNGLELGKVSAQMIKKIEELTLYVIEQEKAINNLKVQNEKLEAKMNSAVEKGDK